MPKQIDGSGVIYIKYRIIHRRSILRSSFYLQIQLFLLIYFNQHFSKITTASMQLRLIDAFIHSPFQCFTIYSQSDILFIFMKHIFHTWIDTSPIYYKNSRCYFIILQFFFSSFFYNNLNYFSLLLRPSIWFNISF